MRVNVAEVVNSSPIGAFQIRTFLLCGLVTLVDGYDIQAMSLAAPQISKEWGVGASAMGPILSATLAGIMVGTLSLGYFGDRLGRKAVLIGSMFVVGLMALASAFVSTPNELLLLRFLTGVGIGGALPNATALTAEFAPERKRSLITAFMYLGVPLGASAAGFLAPSLIATFGWRSIFVLGGVAPLLLCLLCAVALPESVQFLTSAGRHRDKIVAILKKIVGNARDLENSEFHLEGTSKRNSIALLFVEGRALATIALWVIFFSSFFGFYLITSWMPVLFVESGWPQKTALQAVGVFQGAVFVGGLAGGGLIDRYRPFLILGLAYFTGGLFILGVGQVAESVPIAMSLTAMVGVLVGGAQVCIVAVAATLYPTSARSTGVGWALGIGRIGAVISPIMAGLAIAAGWPSHEIFLLAGVPALICGVVALAVALRAASRPAQPAPDPAAV
jgi:AAHS family 4-hydroxybenzoate transporter-like MFS transporter